MRIKESEACRPGCGGPGRDGWKSECRETCEKRWCYRAAVRNFSAYNGTICSKRQKDIIEIVFYALVDTGADVSMCSKDLVEKMFRWNPEDSISIDFPNKKAKKYQYMKKLCDGSMVKAILSTFWM